MLHIPVYRSQKNCSLESILFDMLKDYGIGHGYGFYMHYHLISRKLGEVKEFIFNLY